MMKLELPPPDWKPLDPEEIKERRKRAFYWIRISKGMTQLEVSQHYGLSDRTWWSYEREGRRPNHEVVAAIAEDTGLPGAWILGEV